MSVGKIALSVADKDCYPLTLVAAINCVTKFHRGAKITTSPPPTNTHHTSLSAAEVPSSKEKGPSKKDKRRQKSADKTPNSNVTTTDKPTKDKSKITCYNCGKLGHYASKEERQRPANTPNSLHLCRSRGRGVLLHHIWSII